MRRSSSWPMMSALWKEILSLSEFDHVGNRILFQPGTNTELPNLFDGGRETGGSDVSSEPPGSICGWCGVVGCPGYKLTSCATWCRLSAELTLHTPRHLVSV